MHNTSDRTRFENVFFQTLLLHSTASDWNCRYDETSPSPHKSGRIDLPVEAAEWLVNFRSQNSQIIKDIKVIVWCWVGGLTFCHGASWKRSVDPPCMLTFMMDSCEQKCPFWGSHFLLFLFRLQSYVTQW